MTEQPVMPRPPQPTMRLKTGRVSLSPSPAKAYLRSWRRLPGELGYLLPALPIAVAAGVLTFTLFRVGVSALPLAVSGVFVIWAALYVARVRGAFELIRLRWTARPAIAAPTWPAAEPGQTFWQRLFRPLRNLHYWAYLLHAAVVSPIVVTITWSLGVIWTWTSVVGLLPFTWNTSGAGLRGLGSGRSVLAVPGGVAPVRIGIGGVGGDHRDQRDHVRRSAGGDWRDRRTAPPTGQLPSR
ncbi:MAG: sensor domain-containing protein [Candidatus Nanopelagicales bacterium]